MADGLYEAAESCARKARRAGLQARRDEQLVNTTKSYASKQCEWEEWLASPQLIRYLSNGLIASHPSCLVET